MSRSIKHIIFDYVNRHLFEEKFIVDLDLRYSGITKGKKSFMNLEITLYLNKDDVDFHFYRQNRNGYWSHKPGSNLVTDRDASNRLITNPDKANRNYGALNYSKKCKKLCVPFKYNEKIDPIVL
jgi:hypothetical protein